MRAGRRGRLLVGLTGGIAAFAVGVGVADRTAGFEHAAAATPTVRVRTDAYGRLHAFDVYYRDLVSDRRGLVHDLAIRYTAWDGAARTAFVVLPRWYGPADNPPLPLVISPHGRGIEARDNLHFWGGLPAFGPFAVISPEGQGRVLTRYSWGWGGEIDDLARMPAILARQLPWVRIDPRRIYAVGSSMGAQETLLLVARYPHLLAGAAALDADTDLAARYRAFAGLRGGARLQALAREEVGGTPRSVPQAYALRSPVHWAAAIARSGVPLQIWWSKRDRVVRNQRAESGRLFRMIRALRPRASVTQYVGDWAHSKEFHAGGRLPLALVELRLIRLDEAVPRPDRIDRVSGLCSIAPWSGGGGRCASRSPSASSRSAPPCCSSPPEVRFRASARSPSRSARSRRRR